jgi:hypothetical protein
VGQASAFGREQRLERPKKHARHETSATALPASAVASFSGWGLMPIPGRAVVLPPASGEWEMNHNFMPCRMQSPLLQVVRNLVDFFFDPLFGRELADHLFLLSS